MYCPNALLLVIIYNTILSCILWQAVVCVNCVHSELFPSSKQKGWHAPKPHQISEQNQPSRRQKDENAAAVSKCSSIAIFGHLNAFMVAPAFRRPVVRHCHVSVRFAQTALITRNILAVASYSELVSSATLCGIPRFVTR